VSGAIPYPVVLKLPVITGLQRVKEEGEGDYEKYI